MGVTEGFRALHAVVDRLANKLPELSRERIEDVVQEEHSSLDKGRVRDFVPALVEHAARDRLSRLILSRYASAEP
ncbi:three-helix bundle dimerization domain-containing protein [Arthrobacter sp. NPDC058097]|uniref:three-helix bundle dimerization domain-containing protein n=1 Tax=Arthrobacter sp. NPDC058097 TaxID=3346340 RepID=UPI0036DD51F1